jgi:hypothetical protein
MEQNRVDEIVKGILNKKAAGLTGKYIYPREYFTITPAEQNDVISRLRSLETGDPERVTCSWCRQVVTKGSGHKCDKLT